MTTYSYDRENRLISQNVDGNVTSFAYDGFGRKKRESRGVNPDVILNWDGDQMIVESSDLDPEAPSKAYYIADDVIYAENSNLGSKRSRRDYAVDFLGSVTGLVDGDCSLSSARRWSAFGKLLSGSAEPIGYFWTGNTGSRVYQSLGLNDNRARHYGRNIKQWITRDPLWPSELPYAYVNGNPVTRIDPSGQSFGVEESDQVEKKLISGWINQLGRAYRDPKLGAAFKECLKSNHACVNSAYAGQDPDTRIDDIFKGSYQGNIVITMNDAANDKKCEGKCAYTEISKKLITVGGKPYSSSVKIVLCKPLIMNARKCGPVMCTLLHELIHAIGYSHEDAFPGQDDLFLCVAKMYRCGDFGIKTKYES